MSRDNNPKTVFGLKKVPLHLIPGPFTVFLALALKLGAKKYGPFNWREEPVSASVYFAACKRHLDAWWDGRDFDPEEGATHELGHAAACIAIIVDAWICGTLIDDRPPRGKGSTGELLAAYVEADEDEDQ